MRSRCLLSAALSISLIALSACRSAPSAPISITLHYGGPGADAPLHLEPRGPIEAAEKNEQVLVARVKNGGAPGEPIVPREPAMNEPDARTAQRMAWIAQWVIQKELGIEDGLGFVVLLFPIPSYHACVATAALPPEVGVAAGVPSVDGAMDGRHATAFLFELIRWYVEAYLANPAIAGCNLYRRSPENRWIADGIASLVAVRAISAALKEKIDLAPMSYVDAIESGRQQGRSEVRLADWTHAAGDTSSRSENLLRQAAAELVCVRWYAAARKRGIERPIEELVKHVRGKELGAAYDELTAWMRLASGLDVARLAEAVPIEDMLKYHKAAWSAMGWKTEPEK